MYEYEYLFYRYERIPRPGFASGLSEILLYSTPNAYICLGMVCFEKKRKEKNTREGKMHSFGIRCGRKLLSLAVGKEGGRL